MATATTDPVRLPPTLRLPKLVQSVLFLTSLQYSVIPRLSRHYGGPVHDQSADLRQDDRHP